ncbi:MAG: hypothetical protein RR547_04440 [Raoultibacter sp.]
MNFLVPLTEVSPSSICGVKERGDGSCVHCPQLTHGCNIYQKPDVSPTSIPDDSEDE